MCLGLCFRQIWTEVRVSWYKRKRLSWFGCRLNLPDLEFIITSN
jgi:hypothetical protein